MRSGDDYYYRAKPAERIALRQSLTPEARGYASTYEDQMHLRGQALPDERTRDGMEWHKTVMGVRSARTIARAIKELLDKGWLVRLQDGRLMNAEVERERIYRAAAKKAGGGGQTGNGGAGSGGAPPRQGVFEVIEGGKGPQPDGDKPVDDGGERGDGSARVADCRPIRVQFPVKLAEILQRNQRAALSTRESVTHEVVAAVSLPLPRARGDPTARA